MAALAAHIRWHRRHRITGVEVGQVPLLVIAVLLLITQPTPPRGQRLFGDLRTVMPLDMWAGVVATVAVVLVASAILNVSTLHKGALGLTAGWWFAVALLLLLNGATVLTAATYATLGISAPWRVADLAVRELTDERTAGG